HHGGQLVSERFSGAGRHDGQDVAAAEDGGDNLFLSVAEAHVAEVRAKLRQRLAGFIPDVHETTTMSSSRGEVQAGSSCVRCDPRLRGYVRGTAARSRRGSACAPS